MSRHRREPLAHGTGSGRVSLAPLAWFAVAAMLGGWLLMLSDAERAIALPCVVASLLGLSLFLYLGYLDKRTPLLDVGMLAVVATLLYMTVPLVGYYVDGLAFAPNADPRLYRYQPDPIELGNFHWRHVLYVGCLCLAYALTRRRALRQEAPVAEPSPHAIHAAVGLLVGLMLYFFILERVTGFSYAVNYEEAREVHGTAQQATLPLAVAQVSHYLYGMMFVFKLVALVFLLKRIKAPLWLGVLIAWVLFEVASTIALKGARTPLVLFMMAGGILFHRIVRPIPWPVLLAGGLVLVWWFLFFGHTRLSRDVSQVGLLTAGNEFQSLLGTSWDIYQRKLDGNLYVPWQVYMHDIMRVLPPQQILPFKKIHASQWYLQLTDPGLRYVRQSGKMWGLTSQAIVGFDWLEMAARGTALGYVLGRVHVWYRRRAASVLVTVAYVWLCVHIYNTYRDGTFTLINRVAYIVLPAILLLVVTERILRGRPANPTTDR